MFEFLPQNRLITKKDFKHVFDKANKIACNKLIMLYRKHSQATPRLGVIISKRYIKLAVNRNWVRRKLRESFRHSKDLLKDLDMVIMIRSECSPMDKTAIQQDIDKLWQQLKVSRKTA